MKILAVVAIAVALWATIARAQITQTITSQPPSTAFGVDPTMRVTTTFRTTVAVTEPQAIPDARAQEMARRALYGMAESECAALSEIFKAECRLSSVSLLLPLVPANAAPSHAINATATYELRLRAGASGR